MTIKNGSKHYVTEVYVDNVSFTGEAKQDTDKTKLRSKHSTEQSCYKQ